MTDTALKALEDYESSAKMRWKLSDRKSDYSSYFDIKQLVKTVKEYDAAMSKQKMYIEAASETLDSFTKMFNYMRRYLGENIWTDMLRNVAIYEFKDNKVKKDDSISVYEFRKNKAKKGGDEK